MQHLQQRPLITGDFPPIFQAQRIVVSQPVSPAMQGGLDDFENKMRKVEALIVSPLFACDRVCMLPSLRCGLGKAEDEMPHDGQKAPFEIIEFTQCIGYSRVALPRGERLMRAAFPFLLNGWTGFERFRADRIRLLGLLAAVMPRGQGI
jgi:hypothetical protein